MLKLWHRSNPVTNGPSFWLIWTGLGLSTTRKPYLCMESLQRILTWTWHYLDPQSQKRRSNVWMYVPIYFRWGVILFSVMCRLKKTIKPALESGVSTHKKRGGPWAEPWWSDAMEEEEKWYNGRPKTKRQSFLTSLRANEFPIFPQPQFLSEERAVMLPHMSELVYVQGLCSNAVLFSFPPQNHTTSPER